MIAQRTQRRNRLHEATTPQASRSETWQEAEPLVGRHRKMQEVDAIVERVADSRATVLITGETGTGKSLLARTIHRRSIRRFGPFVEVACGALPELLLESELFGHVAGAFTGAARERIGRFMQADGGTIFLDEIAAASPNMQVKLLRVLQDMAFEQVGGAETFRVDARVILATNEDLARAVDDGRFRRDLFYRVNVINVQLPPLRERIGDVPFLAEHFFNQVRDDACRTVRGISHEAMAALEGYAWPGNVRELRNVIERAVLLGGNELISMEDLPAEVTSRAPADSEPEAGRTLKEALTAPERQIILEALEGRNWNRHATAEVLGINRATLYKKMKQLGLRKPQTVAT